MEVEKESPPHQLTILFFSFLSDFFTPVTIVFEDACTNLAYEFLSL